MKRLTPGVILTLILMVNLVSPVQAGDPDDTIGPINPNLFVCATPDHLIVPVDSDAFGGDSDPSVDIAFFDEDIEVDLDQLEEDCEEAEEEDGEDLRVELLRQTRIEGYVYEFYPDPASPIGGPRRWIGTPSRDVPVVATGVGFEIFWGSEKDGFYYFDYLGAGPITLNLRLPPDAHPVNPNITLVSTSFAEVWTVPLGFYRGDIAPGEDDIFTTPTGEQLPPGNFIFEGPAGDGLIEGMPNVGGVLPQEGSAVILIFAGLMLLVLPLAGIFKLRR